MVDINVLGLLYVSHAALPQLLAAAEDSPRRVRILVNISSVPVASHAAAARSTNATKHGVGAFSEALRQEITRDTSRVSLIEPARWRRNCHRITAGGVGDHPEAVH